MSSSSSKKNVRWYFLVNEETGSAHARYSGSYPDENSNCSYGSMMKSVNETVKEETCDEDTHYVLTFMYKSGDLQVLRLTGHHEEVTVEIEQVL